MILIPHFPLLTLPPFLPSLPFLLASFFFPKMSPSYFHVLQKMSITHCISLVFFFVCAGVWNYLLDGQPTGDSTFEEKWLPSEEAINSSSTRSGFHVPSLIYAGLLIGWTLAALFRWPQLSWVHWPCGHLVSRRQHSSPSLVLGFFLLPLSWCFLSLGWGGSEKLVMMVTQLSPLGVNTQAYIYNGFQHGLCIDI